MATCGKVERLIQAHMDNELTAAERVVFEHHVSKCTSCARQVALNKSACATLFETFGEDRLHGSLRAKVLAHLPEMDHRPDAHPSWQPQYKTVRFQWLRTLAPALAPILVLLLGVTLFYAWPPSELLSAEVLGMVTQSAGQVTKHAPRATERQRVTLRTAVYPGERFETRSNSNLILALAGATLLKADENTRFKVENDRRILLESGRIWLEVGKNSHLFRVETPSGGVTVFGTTFDVLLEDTVEMPEAKMTVTVAKGVVHVESGVGFTQLRPDQQVQVVLGQRTLVPIKVDAGKVMAWADRLHPVAAPEDRFATLKSGGAPDMDAWSDTMYLVPVEGRPVTSLVLSWLPDAYHTGHSGYHVYVYDNRLAPLFTDYIPGHVFDMDDDNSYVMTAPPGQPLDGAGALRIRLVPDRLGIHATTFMEPYVSN